MPGSMLSTSPAYITVRSPPFLASAGGLLVFCAGFSELESSQPQPATARASAAAIPNVARNCAANLICTYPPLGMGQGSLSPRALQLARSVIDRTASRPDLRTGRWGGYAAKTTS